MQMIFSHLRVDSVIFIECTLHCVVSIFGLSILEVAKGDVKMARLFKKKSFFVIIITAICLIYIFFPRKIIWLMPEEIRNHSIEICYIYEEGKTITLSAQQQAEMVDLFSANFARLKLVRTKYVNDNEMGLYIYISDNKDDIFFFSREIIVINGVQYKIYEPSLAQQLKEIIESEK